MRLTTLSRKIDKTPTQLITFLEKHEIHLEKGLHSILEKETVELVLSHFLPEGTEEPSIIPIPEPEAVLAAKEPEVVVPEIVEPEPIKEKKEIKKATVKKKKKENEDILDKEAIEPPQVVEEIVKAAETQSVEETKPEPKTGTVDDLESEDFEKIELIKAKKVKLEGFKVVGKIDLPEKVKKEDPAAESTDGEEKVIKKPERPNRKFDRDRKKKKGATLRNTLSYEERMKREEREKLRQRKKKEREAKLRNKKLYEETIQSKVSKTPKKKSGKKKFLAGQEKSEVKIHKNPIKRLWAWLNGQYDKF